MKIEAGGVATGQLQTEWASKPSTTSTSSAASTQNSGGDHATLSSDSASVQSLVTQALNTPDVRQDKVQALRQAVSSGTYQVDPQKLATAMMNDS